MSKPRLHLPLEILDSVFDLLRNDPETLKGCSLVSKSWLSRTRMHLFVDIKLKSAVDLEAWKKTFPNPACSPAYYTRSLFVGCLEAITVADGEEGGWIRSFTNVVRLNLVWSDTTDWHRLKDSFVPFHNFSPTLRSLHLVSTTFLSPYTFDLVCSLPLLEDLAIVNDGYEANIDDEGGVAFRYPTSPVLTGTLSLLQGLKYAIPRLLSLPNGLRFRKFVCESFLEGDLQRVAALVKRCSDTLECVDVRWWMPNALGNLSLASIDLSGATKLKEVVFRFDGFNIIWVTATLKTITFNHRDLQQVTIHIPFRSQSNHGSPTVRRGVVEATYSQWMDLDSILVQLWESYAVRVKAVYCEARDGRDLTRKLIAGVLPEITKRGVINMVNSTIPQ